MRLLVVQTSNVGDLVMTAPLLGQLRRQRPAAHLALVTTAAGAELLDGLADEFLVTEKRWGRGVLRGLPELRRRLRAAPWDAALAPHRSLRSGWIVHDSAARVRIGFAGSPAAWAYTHRVPRDLGVPCIERYLALASPLGLERSAGDDRPRLVVDRAARARVETWLAEARVGRPLVCLAPGARWATKRWPASGFATLARELARGGRGCVLVGERGESALCRAIAALAGAGTRDFSGRLTLRELAALFELADLVVANDSGAGHVAAAVGTPVVSLFGPTVPALGYEPRGAPLRIVERAGLRCRPCHRHGPERCPLGHFRCMRGLPWDAALAAADALLRERADLTRAAALHHNPGTYRARDERGGDVR